MEVADSLVNLVQAAALEAEKPEECMDGLALVAMQEVYN